jgi:hypothetical protein
MVHGIWKKHKSFIFIEGFHSRIPKSWKKKSIERSVGNIYNLAKSIRICKCDFYEFLYTCLQMNFLSLLFKRNNNFFSLHYHLRKTNVKLTSVCTFNDYKICLLFLFPFSSERINKYDKYDFSFMSKFYCQSNYHNFFSSFIWFKLFPPPTSSKLS